MEKAGETLAFFGKAKLIRKFKGKHELLGGKAEYRATAREWCSRFVPEFLFSDTSRHEIILSA